MFWNPSVIWELIRSVSGGERRAEPSVSWNIPSFLPFPPSPAPLHFLLCIIDRGNADSWSELQETLFPGEGTSRAVLPAGCSASFCPMPFSWACTQSDWEGVGPAQAEPVRSLSLGTESGTGSSLCLSSPFRLWPHDAFPSHLPPLPPCSLRCGHTWLLPVLCEHLVFSSRCALAHGVPCLEWPLTQCRLIEILPMLHLCSGLPAGWSLLGYPLLFFVLSFGRCIFKYAQK